MSPAAGETRLNFGRGCRTLAGARFTLAVAVIPGIKIDFSPLAEAPARR